MTILYEIGDIERFPTVKDFLSYCRLVKGTVASAGKFKGLRGANHTHPGAPHAMRADKRKNPLNAVNRWFRWRLL